MKFTSTLLALAIATAVPNAFAQSANLEVTGTIFPGACSIELGGGGIVDLGRINARDLRPDAPTRLPEVEVPVTVSCESEVRYALDGIDNTSVHPSSGYGLGLTPHDELIGRLGLFFAGRTADGVAAYSTVSVSNGQTWSRARAGNTGLAPSEIVGFSKVEGVDTGPSPIKLLQAMMGVDPIIHAANSLTIEDEVPINGSITIDLKYL